VESALLKLETMVEYKVPCKEDEGSGFLVWGNLEALMDDVRKVINRGDCFRPFFDTQLILNNFSTKNAEILLVNYYYVGESQN
jgi:hypothetical protein